MAHAVHRLFQPFAVRGDRRRTFGCCRVGRGSTLGRMITVVGRLLPLLLVLSDVPLAAQTRLMAQDPALDNLNHPPNTPTVPLGSLGNVRKIGSGSRTLVLIPGLGFGGSIWTEFMERHAADFTMYAVTLPGFGETPPLPMPPAGSRFAETPWTRSAMQAVRQLLDTERLDRVTIVAHWALASQIALQLALDLPDRIDAVVLVSGVLKVHYENVPRMLEWTADERSANVESLGHKWFKTVTRRTWDDNNYMSYDYAINPRRGLFLWREAQAPLLSVWIRYLLEFYSIDVSPRLKDLRVPTLVIQPGLDDPGFYVDQGVNYMRSLCVESWRSARDINNKLEFTTVPQSRLFIMHDQPEALDRAIVSFLRRVATGSKDRR
jgi:pimeloyl-ACP methyl ester carboxylesterase